MNTKHKYIQVRMNDEDKKLAERLSIDYNVSVSELVRFALMYLDDHRPALTITITPSGKVLAPALEMSLN